MVDYDAPVEKIGIYQLEVAESYDSTTTYIPVGNKNWGSTPKKIPIKDSSSGDTSTIHKEASRYQITSTTIDESFNTAFSDIPINIKSIQVYKIVDGYRYNFLLKNLIITASKFTATVENVDPDYVFSDFSGIILEYCLFERS
jgi:hypothetical protein